MLRLDGSEVVDDIKMTDLYGSPAHLEDSNKHQVVGELYPLWFIRAVETVHEYKRERNRNAYRT